MGPAVSPLLVAPLKVVQFGLNLMENTSATNTAKSSPESSHPPFPKTELDLMLARRNCIRGEQRYAQ